MAVITVTSNADSGAGSLRQAIIDAAAGDTIVFHADLAGQTITLASQITINKDLTINGDVNGDRKADITISGNNATRIFLITGTGVDIELRSLTLTQGSVPLGFGGAIATAFGSTLTLINSTVSHSFALGGGGIFADGVLAAVSSTITGNNANAGGGVFSTATASFINATVHLNGASVQGGGIANVGTLTVLNSTITENTAAQNNGGILGADISIRNSVIAGNTAPSAADVSHLGSAFAAGSSFFGTAVILTTDQGGNIINGGDPKLGALADNGGPVQTQAILPGSPLIGAGNSALLPLDSFDMDSDGNIAETLPLDARGNARILNGALDIGANESGLVVTTASDSASAGNDIGASLAADIADGGGLSLREAIAWAEAGETITFAADLAGQTIVLEQGQLVLDKDLTINGDINGDRKADITISGNDATRIFQISGSGAEVELRSLTLRQGHANDYGGAILLFPATTLAVIDSTVSDSSAAFGGGGVYSVGTLTVVNSTLTGNHSSFGGGAFMYNGSASFVNATIHDNHTTDAGGGVVSLVNTTFLNSSITGNSSGASGGGLRVSASGQATIHNSVVAANTAFVFSDVSNLGTLNAGSSFFGTVVTITTDQGGNIINGGDPQLGALSDNGGPVWTRAILGGSPLIGAGNPAFLPADSFDLDGDANTAEALPLDSRGFARVLNGVLDIGATEHTPPVLTDVTATVTFAENTVNVTPQLIDADVTLTDPDDNFLSGTLTVIGLLAEDIVSIRNQGNGAGQIGFNAGTGQLTFAGIAIGSAYGGAGETLTVDFSGAATAAAIEALIENLTYANSSDAPTPSRTLTITVTDAHGSATSAAIDVEVIDESDIGVTIVGTKTGDLVDATNTVAGQPLPTGLNDIILGGNGDDDLSGLLGNDTIDGGKGDDILLGDAGNDILNGGKANDILLGGDGDDILQVKGKEGRFDIFESGAGNDTLQFLGNGHVTLAGFDALASSIEILQGNGRGLLGTGAPDVFNFIGLTQVTGLAFVDGKGGDDILMGSAFADDLRGGKGNDLLNGGAGDDVLRGGNGNDTFVFADGYGADSIVDYQRGKDILDLTGVAGVHSFADLLLTQIDNKTVLIDFGNGDTLTIQRATIAILTANQGDFLFA
ncbi:beta strand repeat-containing protein [Pseudorhodoplanes sp.]|uniref:beta strand repeat-containing protein n=1 Tax=Pseudorhodoplanes sp. TaxID=1934341 RepID=UPI00391C520A